MCHKPSGENPIAEILSIINILQRNASPENGIDSCDKPSLGGGNSCLVCNTRPVMIYTCSSNGVPFSMPTSKDLINSCSTSEEAIISPDSSSVFRVEKIEGKCATFRVLMPNPNFNSKNRNPFIGTNSFFTFNIDCACAVRCLSDCYVDCI